MLPFHARLGLTDACICASHPRLWWVTDASRLRKKDEQKADEDGPTSSEDEEAQDEGERKKPDDALTSDSDPDSSRSDRGESQSQQAVVLPVRHDTRRRHDPSVSWPQKCDRCLICLATLLPPLFSCIRFHPSGTVLSARARALLIV